MRSIISHKAQEPSLPDFRNLGTILRILLAVNGAAAALALAQSPRFDAFSARWTEITGLVVPWLLLVLAVLWPASPWLRAQPYRIGAAAVVAVVVLAGLGVELALPLTIGPTTFSLLRDLILALALTAVLLAYFQLRARALSPAIAEARLQALQARIRPHFLFNSINAVLSLVRSDPARAEAALQDLADLFRVLMRDNRELAPLANEVELCRQYLDLEKLRLGERLIVDWNVKSMPEDALVPPLVLQPLIENAVYHGIEPSAGPGTLSINIFLSKGDVHAVLRNPFHDNGKRHQKGNKMALGNVRERLALHFDAEASLESRVSRDSYEVHIRMPYRTVKPPRPAGEAERRKESRNGQRTPQRHDPAARAAAWRDAFEAAGG